MSIILDALKKAGKKKEPSQPKDSDPDKTDISQPPSSGPVLSPSSPGPQNKKPRLLVILLGLLLGLALAYFFFGDSTQLQQVKNKIFSEQKNEVQENKTQTIMPQDLSPQNSEPNTLEQVKDLKIKATKNFQENNLQEALKNYANLVLLVPTDPEVYNNYGVALKKSGQIEDAKKAYQRAIALKKNEYPEALNNLGVVLMAEDKYPEAREPLQQAIALNPDYIDPYLHLAITLEKTGQLNEAANYYEKFLKLSVGKVDRKIRLLVEERLTRLKN